MFRIKCTCIDVRARVCVSIYIYMGVGVAQWLRHCATYWKVAGSIPAGVIGIFH